MPSNWEFEVSEPTWCSTITAPPVYYKGIIYGYEVFADDSVPMENGDAYQWICNAPASQTPPASSRFAIAGNIPPSVTLTGIEPFSSTYGMPILYMYDGTNGNPSLAAKITASSVSTDGSSSTFPLPSSLAANAYSLITTTATSSGTYTPNSYNFYSIASSQTIAGNPFGVAVNALTETTQFCKWYPGLRGQPPYLYCQSPVTTQSTAPAVSLYSQNQVLIGGTAVTVGANPTAVVAYNGGQVDRGASPSTDTISGTTRAIVADSGTNLVSILDTVSDTLLENVIVGNQPVALAVSPDGTTAYVANYGDSTVTQVNLVSGTTPATIPVGGQPM